MRALKLLTVCLLAAGAGGCSAKASIDSVFRRLFGPAPKELVSQMFQSPDPDLRREAIERLSAKEWGRRAPYTRGYAALAELDPSAGVRAAAVGALGRSGDVKYVKAVIEALTDPDEVVRWDAAVALGSLVDDTALAPLGRSAKADPAKEVRAAAARALRNYRRNEALEALLACLNDPEYAVRYAAAQSLRELTGLDCESDVELWQEALAGKKDPFAPKPHPPKAKRPWWDLLGTTKPKPDKPEADKAGPAEGEPPPKTRPATPVAAPKKKRPWWDLLGITK